jgi:hypothetical protein
MGWAQKGGRNGKGKGKGRAVCPVISISPSGNPKGGRGRDGGDGK